MKVVIIGKGEMLTNLIEGVLDSGNQIAAVMRYERTKYNHFLFFLKDIFNPSHEKIIIKRYNLKEIKCPSANSETFRKILLKYNADILLVGTWGEKLIKATIDTPVIASVNVHPSLLPKYRGPNPYLQNILRGETKSGITFHLMDENFDTGPILAQEEIDILPNDTSKELKIRTVYKARLMCSELMKKLEHGLIIPIPQKDGTYYHNIDDYDKMLDFKRETAAQIHSRIRALHPWLPTYYTYKDKFFIPNPYKLKIINTNSQAEAGTIIDTNYKTSSITVKCLNNKALKMDGTKLYGFFNNTKSFIKSIKI